VPGRIRVGMRDFEQYGSVALHDEGSVSHTD
jgi:hypothetical protein